MSLDAAIQDVVLQAVREVVVKELAPRLSEGSVTVLTPGERRPLDSKALMDRGYTEQEAYALLRAHGVRIPGGRRRRIALDVLEAIERGETPA